MKKIPESQNNSLNQLEQEELLANDKPPSDQAQGAQIQLQQNEINQQEPSPQVQPQQYDEYGEYDEYGGEMIMLEESINPYHIRLPSEGNTQCEMQDLVNIIEKQTQKVIEISGFDRCWALIYYQTCGWKMNLVDTFIDEKLSSHQMISYTPKTASISTLNGTCDVCCLQDKIIFRNSCGDEFCENCWKSHLEQRLKNFNSQPFPPCINCQCSVKTSPFILEQISKSDPNFKKLYLRTLCRSYAIGNTSVKFCKGREKVSCDRFFKVVKLMEIILCESCGNLVCGRCGQEYHVPSECFEGLNWRKVVEQSTNFVQTLNYKICPFCKQAVQRSVGCNSVVCKCRQTFCYTCGQKWFPNHTIHGLCYRQKEIQALDEQRKRKHQNQKEYIDKLQKFKAEIENYLGKIRKIDSLDVKGLRDELITRFQILSNEMDYLQPLRKKLKIALLMGKNYVLSLYFNDSEVMKAELSNLVPLIEQCLEYLICTLQDLLEVYRESSKMSSKALKIRKQVKENNFDPRQFLAKGKLQMLQLMRNLDKYIIN